MDFPLADVLHDLYFEILVLRFDEVKDYLVVFVGYRNPILLTHLLQKDLY